MIKRFVALFPVWAIMLSGVAYVLPAFFVPGKAAIIPLLCLVMFAMGMTLNWTHFKQVLAQPLVISIALIIQFLMMPAIAYGLALLFELPVEQRIGMVLVGSSAGGTASNVICYLAKGNVALSILMTLASTICAVFFMPFFSYLYLQHSVTVPVEDMMKSIFVIVLFPVLAGITINSLFHQYLRKVEYIFPALSSLAIIIIIAIIVAINHSNLSILSIPILSAVILHNLLGLMIGYLIPKALGFDAITCRTVSIEVGMQNSGLSVALAIKYFSTGAALPGALFSIWHNISGSILAAFWRKSRLL